MAIDNKSLTLRSLDDTHQYVYFVQFEPFRIEQYLNDTLTMLVNDADSLFFEDFSVFKYRDKNETSDEELTRMIQNDPIYPIL
jgi:hypothetical protein